MEYCYFTVFLINHRASIFRRDPRARWQIEPLSGEEQTELKPSHAKDELLKLLEKLSKNLNRSSQLNHCQITLIYEKEAVPYLMSFAELSKQLQCTDWQLLRWDSLCRKIEPNIKKIKEINGEWLLKKALPLLDSIADYDEAVLSQLHIDHEDTVESLRLKEAQLNAKIQQLNKQIAAMGNPEFNTLLSFLPVIYEKFWTHIAPADLAILNHQFDIPQIPSPFPEPSIMAVNAAKRQIDALPEDEQQKLYHFCELLNEHYDTLRIRPQMRYFVQGDHHE